TTAPPGRSGTGSRSGPPAALDPHLGGAGSSTRCCPDAVAQVGQLTPGCVGSPSLGSPGPAAARGCGLRSSRVVGPAAVSGRSTCVRPAAGATAAVLATFHTTDPLKDVHVLAYDASGSQVNDSHRLLSYVVAEVELDGHRYALSAGQWF